MDKTGLTAAYRKLGLAVVHRALMDSRYKNDHVRMRALSWLLSDGPRWLDELNVDYSPEQFYDRVLGKGKVKNVRI